MSDRGNMYSASIMYEGTYHFFGTFQTKADAGIAYDRFVVDKSTNEVTYALNYPNMSDQEREEAMKKLESPKKRKRTASTSSDLPAVSSPIAPGTPLLQSFGLKNGAWTPVPAAQAPESEAPKKSDHEREKALKVEPPPKKTKRGNPNPSTGLIGVYKNGKKYIASINMDCTPYHLGSYTTKEEAGVAYDRFVVGKSDEQVTFVLNYPNMTDQEREK